MVATQGSWSAALLKNSHAMKYDMINITKMFCGRITERLPRQVPDLPQRSYGMATR